MRLTYAIGAAAIAALAVPALASANQAATCEAASFTNYVGTHTYTVELNGSPFVSGTFVGPTFTVDLSKLPMFQGTIALYSDGVLRLEQPYNCGRPTPPPITPTPGPLPVPPPVVVPGPLTPIEPLPKVKRAPKKPVRSSSVVCRKPRIKVRRGNGTINCRRPVPVPRPKPKLSVAVTG